jgi:hypothetical protein
VVLVAVLLPLVSGILPSRTSADAAPDAEADTAPDDAVSDNFESLRRNGFRPKTKNSRNPIFSFLKTQAAADEASSSNDATSSSNDAASFSDDAASSSDDDTSSNHASSPANDAAASDHDVSSADAAARFRPRPAPQAPQRTAHQARRGAANLGCRQARALREKLDVGLRLPAFFRLGLRREPSARVHLLDGRVQRLG